MRTGRVAVVAVVVVATAAMTVACASAPDATAPTSRDPQAVRAAREAVGPPLEGLGTAVTSLASAVADVRMGQPPAPEQRLVAVEEIRREPLASVGQRRDAVAALEQEVIQHELAAVVDASDGLIAAATADLELVSGLAAADRDLAAHVATWDEPGSRSQQLERLAATAVSATELADQLAAGTTPPCAGAIERRVAAARHVATASEELRDLVAGRQGGAFDTRRQQLTADPYGLGATDLARLDEQDRACWREQGATATASDDFDAAVDDLVAALNPPSS